MYIYIFTYIYIYTHNYTDVHANTRKHPNINVNIYIHTKSHTQTSATPGISRVREQESDTYLQRHADLAPPTTSTSALFQSLSVAKGGQVRAVTESDMVEWGKYSHLLPQQQEENNDSGTPRSLNDQIR